MLKKAIGWLCLLPVIALVIMSAVDNASFVTALTSLAAALLIAGLTWLGVYLLVD